MKDLFKRLGTQIILLSVASLAITVAIVLTVSLIMFGSYNDSILVERSVVGLNVLENKLDEKMTEIRTNYDS